MNFALLGSSPLIGNFESQLANSKIHRRVYRSDDLQQVELADLAQLRPGGALRDLGLYAGLW